jgi:CMP-N-acetylneuraminic acid synthetase
MRKSVDSGISAVILARGGSKGIPGKNLKKINGTSLIGRTIVAARDCNILDEIYLSTDDELIAEEAKKFGATIINRPAEISGDEASSEAGWLHALREIKSRTKKVDFLTFLQCTSPFTTGKDISGCIEGLLDSKASCSLSVIEDHSFMWQKQKDGFGHGMNHDENSQRARRQDLPPYYKENGAIYCVRVADFERVKRRFCGPVILYTVNHPAVEIDTLDDLEICRAICKERQSSS